MWVDCHMFNLNVVLPKHLLTVLTTLQRGNKQMSNFISLSPPVPPLCFCTYSIFQFSYCTVVYHTLRLFFSQKMREIDYPARLVGFFLSLVECFCAVA